MFFYRMEAKISKFLFLIALFTSAVLGTGCGGGKSNSSATDVISSADKIEPLPSVSSHLPNSTAQALPLIPLKNKLVQLAQFTRIAHQVQFFHPSDGVMKTNWNEFIQYGMYKTAQVNTSAEQVANLTQLFADVAPEVKFNEPDSSTTIADNETVMVWQNRGFQDQTQPLEGAWYTKYTKNNGFERARLSLKKTTLAQSPQLPQQIYYRTQIGEIKLELPLMQSAKSKLSRAYAIPNEFMLSKSFNDPYHCLTGAAKIWGSLQHFWPYFKDITVNWDAELEPLLSACMVDKEPAKSLDSAVNLALTKLQDNHIEVSIPDVIYYGRTPDMHVQWIENRPIVDYIGADVRGIKLGDEVLAVDGISTDKIIADGINKTLKNSMHSISEVLNSFLTRPRDSQLSLQVKHSDGSMATIQVINDSFWSISWQKSSQSYIFGDGPIHKILPNNIHYLNLSKVTTATQADLLQKLRPASGIIFDLRDYPVDFSAWRDFLRYFNAGNNQSLPMYEYYPTTPSPNFSARIALPQFLTPLTPTFTVPKVALSSRFSQSQNEHALGYIQSAKIPIVGEVTSGINGTINFIMLDGADGNQMVVSFTGLEVRQHDGSRFIGVGIQPNVLVKRTITGIVTNTDEVLDAALVFLKTKMQ